MKIGKTYFPVSKGCNTISFSEIVYRMRLSPGSHLYSSRPISAEFRTLKIPKEFFFILKILSVEPGILIYAKKLDTALFLKFLAITLLVLRKYTRTHYTGLETRSDNSG